MADKTGRVHQNCATLKKGKVYKCGLCGEGILHTGNGKVHENCRSLRGRMGEGNATRYLHEAVARRGQKREGKDPRWVFSHQPKYNMSKKDDHRPPLPAPDQPYVPDSPSTDEEMPWLQTPSPPCSTDDESSVESLDWDDPIGFFFRERMAQEKLKRAYIKKRRTDRGSTGGSK